MIFSPAPLASTLGRSERASCTYVHRVTPAPCRAKLRPVTLSVQTGLSGYSFHIGGELIMHECRPALAAILLLLSATVTLAQSTGSSERVAFPGPVWPHKTPAEAGMNSQLLKEAIDFAIARETKNPRNLKLNHYQTFGREPFGDAIGPIKDRG